MNETLYYLSINNAIYALFIIIIALIISFLLNKIVDITPMGSHNDLSLEGLRGISCLLVFIAHSYLAVSTTGIKSPVFEIQPIYAFAKMGSFGVDMFFCLTGFLFATVIKNSKIDISFFQRRIYRLLPAYLVASTIVLIIFISLKYSQIKSIDDILLLLQRIYGFGFWGNGVKLGSIVDNNLNVVIWTLPYEWKFYAIIPFLACAYSIKPLKILIVPFSCIVIYFGYTNDTVLWTNFLTGFLASYITKSENKYTRYISYLGMTILFIFILFTKQKPHAFATYICISIFFFLFIYSRPPIFRNKTIANIGIVSYSLYLLHQPALSITFNLYSIFIDLKNISTSLFMLLLTGSILLALISSYIMYNYIEKRFRLSSSK